MPIAEQILQLFACFIADLPEFQEWRPHGCESILASPLWDTPEYDSQQSYKVEMKKNKNKQETDF